MIFTYLLPVLGCVAMMGAMMWMMRGRSAPEESPSADRRAEIDALRAEVDSLRNPAGESPPTSRRG
ncbi:hypothetical protein PO878_04655 [Iamia majanohamensis]|uniref:Uncharacterized protein n=1 Tax=Iamia majanohamensis TaxID=467976 RepID=A0AAE9YBD8_9ACTN|nr:hypothetical protein [Iamia majanohamensis]WCO68013.1 hypothetical protein PO878_04655 [Iamia majanohamensis]